MCLREEHDMLSAEGTRQTASASEKGRVNMTACEYCVHGCPMKIAIPQYFALYNSLKRTTGSWSSQRVYFNNLVLAGHGKPGACIKCGRCERSCPQHLPIRSYLEKVAGTFESGNAYPTRWKT